MDSNPIFKRVKERSVWEAKEKVDRWRELFEEGIVDQAGKTIRLTLKQAAEYVGIPKKTLEDYHQLLRKVSQITPLQNLKDRKMGYLRQFLKENKCKDTSEQFSYNEQFEQQDAMMEQEQPQEDDNIDNLEQLPPGPFYYEDIQQQQHAEPQTPPQEFIQVAAPGNWEDMIVEGPTAPYHCDEEIEMAYYHRLQETRNPFLGRNFYEETTQFRTHTINYLIIQPNILPLKEDGEDGLDEKMKSINTDVDETDFDSEPEIYQLDTDDED